MLFKLSLANIKKSFKDYTIYFFTLIIGIAIFYIFNSIEAQTVFLNVSQNTKQIISLMSNILSGVSVFVSCILGFLIIYASRFLIKRRNKEFGIYLTLGMSKKQISKILILENIFIGIISLVAGIILGIISSQFMSVFVAKMFEANMTKYEFVFSQSACIKTILYFMIMYLIVILFNVVSISKCKLIDLLNANKKSEKVKIKNQVVCVIIFIISCIMLATAYYLVTKGLYKLIEKNVAQIFIPIILGVIGTFLLFYSISGLVLKIVTSIKKVYYKDLNIFVTRQISSKINTTVITLSIISIMLFITITMLSTAFALKYSTEQGIKTLAPVDVQIEKFINPTYYEENITAEMKEKANEFSNKNIEEVYLENGVDLNNLLEEKLIYNIYHLENLTLKDSLKDSLDEVYKQFPMIRLESKEDIIEISEYNKIAKMYNRKQYTLEEDEYMVVGDFENMLNIRNISLSKGQKININDKILKPKYNKCMDGILYISGNHVNTGLIIVPDNTMKKENLYTTCLIGNYNEDSKEKRQLIDKKILDAKKKMYDKYEYFETGVVNTKLDIIEANNGISNMVIFIGIYIGGIFVISAAVVLSIKELSEFSDNRKRYEILRKIGVDEKLINKALFKEIAVFFLMPLVVAIIHSIFGIQFAKETVISLFGTTGIKESMFISSIVMLVIYGGYLLITYVSSKNIIKGKN